MSRLYICLAALFSLSLFSASALADVTGVWSTIEGKSHVKIEPCGDKLCGKIIWLKEPLNSDGSPKIDIHNSDNNQRDRPIIGLELLKGFVPNGSNEWDDGQIYNPEDGNTYNSTMILTSPKILDVKGCVLFFCKTQTWNKVE